MMFPPLFVTLLVVSGPAGNNRRPSLIVAFWYLRLLVEVKVMSSSDLKVDRISFINFSSLDWLVQRW